MPNKYTETINKIITWVNRVENNQGVIIIGSQAPEQLSGAQWSDLDLTVLTDKGYAIDAG
jgi:hypothetical protein